MGGAGNFALLVVGLQGHCRCYNGVQAGSWWQQGRTATVGSLLTARRGEIGAPPSPSTTSTMLAAAMLLLPQISGAHLGALAHLELRSLRVVRGSSALVEHRGISSLD